MSWPIVVSRTEKEESFVKERRRRGREEGDYDARKELQQIMHAEYGYEY